MSLLQAHGHHAVFRTPEGDTYRIPLVCWREEGDHVYGMALIKGHLRRVEHLPNFLQYAAQNDEDSTTPTLDTPATNSPPNGTPTPALR